MVLNYPHFLFTPFYQEFTYSNNIILILACMGTRSVYQCNKCDYRVETSGGFDYGMRLATDAYLCSKCKEIVAVSVGVYGEKLSPEECVVKQAEMEFNMDFYKCPECGSGDHLILWDTKKKPCPKCGGRLKKDRSQSILLWD